MITVETREQIRRAFFNQNKTIRQIARELRCSRKTVPKAIQSAQPSAYSLRVPRSAPVSGPFKPLIEQLLAENERMPRKQRYTAHKIFEVLQAAGYPESEPSVRGYVAQCRKAGQGRTVYLPLEFDLGARSSWPSPPNGKKPFLRGMCEPSSIFRGSPVASPTTI